MRVCVCPPPWVARTVLINGPYTCWHIPILLNTSAEVIFGSRDHDGCDRCTTVVILSLVVTWPPNHNMLLERYYKCSYYRFIRHNLAVATSIQTAQHNEILIELIAWKTTNLLLYCINHNQKYNTIKNLFFFFFFFIWTNKSIVKNCSPLRNVYTIKLWFLSRTLPLKHDVITTVKLVRMG